MSEYDPPVLRTRREQMYFPLDAGEIDRLRRFGETAHFAAGDLIVRSGETGLGMVVILSGQARLLENIPAGDPHELEKMKALFRRLDQKRVDLGPGADVDE